MDRNRTAAPAELVTNGSYNFGTYNGPIHHINPLDVTRRLPRVVSNLRLKEWEAFQAGNDEWFMCGAVYSAKLLGLVQLIAVERSTGKIYRWLSKVPATSVHVASGLNGTRSTGSAGAFKVEIENHVDQTEDAYLQVTASHPGSASLPPLELSIIATASPKVAPHLVICHPFADDRALYSHKTTLPASGTLRIGNNEIALTADRSYFLLDDHKGDYPTPMKYDWVTGVGHADGRLVGFNLTRNQIREPSVYNENAIFIPGDADHSPEVYRLPPISVQRPKGPHGPWTATDDNGQVDIEFTPIVRSEMHVGPRRILAEYFGPYGSFTGRISTDEFELNVDNFFGMGEQKRISL